MTRFRLILAAALWLLALPVPAFDGDWVLEERFNSQLALAEQGNVQAQYEVGRMYEKGQGVKRDLGLAVEWLNRAASKGSNAARTRLGTLYLEGRGVQKNAKTAYRLLRPAAEAGFPAAQFHLAELYEAGNGVGRDLDAALSWYRKAEQNGYYPAKAKVEALHNELARVASRAAPSAAPAPKPAPAPRRDPAAELIELLLAGKWQRGGKPPGFLPSAITRCEPDSGNSIKCVSGLQQYNTGAALVSYRTEATLSGFSAQGDFEIAYVNDVTHVAPVDQEQVDDAGPVKISVKVGRQDVVHKLACRLESAKALTCTKDRIRTLEFTN